MRKKNSQYLNIFTSYALYKNKLFLSLKFLPIYLLLIFSCSSKTIFLKADSDLKELKVYNRKIKIVLPKDSSLIKHWSRKSYEGHFNGYHIFSIWDHKHHLKYEEYLSSWAMDTSYIKIPLKRYEPDTLSKEQRYELFKQKYESHLNKLNNINEK